MNSDESPDIEHLGALAETTSDALVTIDTDSLIRFANPAIEDVLGYDPEELLGEPLTDLMTEDLARRHDRAIERYLETGTRTLDWDHVELPGRHRDGHEVPLEISFSEFTLEGDRYFTGVLRDVSDRKTLEAERDLLHAARDRVVTAETFSEGLETALALIGESMNWVYADAWVPGEGRDHFEWETAWESDAVDPGAFRDATARRTFEPGHGLVGRVWETAEYEWIPDVSGADSAAFHRSAIATDDDLNAALGVPIRADGRVVAILVFLMTEERPVDERMVEATRMVATDLGLLMGRKRAEEALRDERTLLSNVLETAPAGIVVVDDQGEFSYANDRAKDILGLEADEVEASPPVEELPHRAFDADGEPLAEGERPYSTVLEEGTDVTLDVQIERPDGNRRWLAVNGTPLRDDEGTVTAAVVAFEDVTERRNHADRLARLNELGQDLAETETFEAACEQVVAAAREVLDLPIATVERYDADEGGLEPCSRTMAAADLVADGPLFAAEGGLAWNAFVSNDVNVSADLERASAVDADQTPLESTIVLPLGKHGVFVAGATEPDAFSETTVTLAKILAANAETALARLDREAALRTRTSELESKNEQLRRVQRVNREIRDITGALMEADSSAEIEQVVCDKLASSDPYRFVWFGKHDLATDEVVPTAWAGVEAGYLDEVTITVDDRETGPGPVGREIQAGEATIQNDLRSEPPFEPWRQAAMRRGYRASIAVPVAYHGAAYGLLSCYASEPSVFSEMEEAVLSELGEMIGYALNAMERYEALVSEDSVELEFAIRDGSDPLMGFLQEHQGRFRLENVRGREAGRVDVFGAFENLSFDRIRSLVERHAGFADLTLIREREEETIVQLSLSGDSVVVTLLDRGAVPTEVRATPDDSRLSIRIPQSALVREFVAFFERRYDDVELVARRESPEPVKTRAEFERSYLDRLTERQEDVLRTAYFAGFFTQPRENTAREVAEMLDVSQPTVSRHIRSGEQKLFEMLFGDADSA